MIQSLQETKKYADVCLKQQVEQIGKMSLDLKYARVVKVNCNSTKLNTWMYDKFLSII